MQIFRHFNDLPADARGSVTAVGNFDGVHRGHREVIGEAGRIARADGLPWSVLTFEPHPREFFAPGAEPFRLTPFRVKVRWIEALGVDNLIVLHFDDAFAHLSAETFVHEVLVKGLEARHVISGYDFVFGHRRQGTCELLLRMGQDEGFDFTAVTAVRDETGDAFSSTRVREALRQGDPRTAARLLGRHHEIEGRVERGERRGQKLGFPTANVSLDGVLQPALGVYAVRAGVDRGAGTAWRDGVANLGRRPTFGGNQVFLESHLFDFSDDLYGQHLRVQLVDFIRPERKFDGADALRAQIAQDLEAARRILATD
jgi:riboflavin kinase/FMN adenylyltransferase